MRIRAWGETGAALPAVGCFFFVADFAGDALAGASFGGRFLPAAALSGEGVGAGVTGEAGLDSGASGTWAEGRIEAEIILFGFFLPEGVVAIETG